MISFWDKLEFFDFLEPENELIILKVGHVSANVRVSDHDGDEVTFNIEKSASPFPGFKDASAYFIIIKQSNTAAVVKLAKSIEDVFAPGDQLTLSITAKDGRLTTRSEVFLTIDEKQHLDPIPDSFNPLLPHLNNRERIPEDTNPGVTTTKDELQIEVTEMTPKESAQAMTTMWSVIVAITLLIIIPSGIVIYWKRHQIYKARNRCCSCVFHADKDGAKVEDANGEFSHELQIKATAGNDYGNMSGLASTDWVKDGKKWEIPRNQIRVFSILGQGCFGQVFKGEAESVPGMEGPTIVAIKTLKSTATEKDKKDLLNELAVMKMMDAHPNVVGLLGCCTDDDPVYVILEYVNGGTLQDFLRKSRSEHHYKNLHGASQTLSSSDLTSFAYQIAKGMEYLASKKLIHRDLAARNVLIDSSDQVFCQRFSFFSCSKLRPFSRPVKSQTLDLPEMSWPITSMKESPKANYRSGKTQIIPYRAAQSGVVPRHDPIQNNNKI